MFSVKIKVFIKCFSTLLLCVSLSKCDRSSNAVKVFLGEYMYAVMILEVGILLLAMYVLSVIYFDGV